MSVRKGRMDEALFTLGRAGKRVLEAALVMPVPLERRPPTQREHFLAVNDVRIAAELAGSLSYFFAYWELPGLGWRHSLIPDAVFRMADRTFAVEFDRGVEGIQFFIRTKIAAYGRGLDGLPLTAILIVTDRDARMASLAEGHRRNKGTRAFQHAGCSAGTWVPGSGVPPAARGHRGISCIRVSFQALFTTREALACKPLKFRGLVRRSHTLLRQKGGDYGKTDHCR